ncbi:hypothetical protein ANO14919_140680 [Xylariales sp. No.14919]|nr:hypothetical protein ANO14919_140680 [Xylariales sp. No.14919]
MLQDKKSDYLLREGKLASALDNITDILKHTKGLADNARAYPRRKNASLFAMFSHLLQRGPRASRGQPAAKRVRGIPEGHGAYVGSLITKANMLRCSR